MPGAGRIASLDGLRGLAALVVVIHHALLTVPGFSAVYWGQPVPAFAQPFAFSPLHVFWAGGEAVLLFFVLSGVVLTLPFLRHPRISWRAYFPSRIVRIYLPVIAAVFLTLLSITIWPRVFTSDHSEWIRAHSEAVSPISVLRDIFLLTGTSWLNSPLWSLRWEMLFSLLLPVYVWLAFRFRRHWLIAGIALASCAAVGMWINSDPLRLLPLFGFGSLIAANASRLMNIRIHIASRGFTITLLSLGVIAAILAVTAHWWIGVHFGRIVDLGANILVYSGVVLIVILSISSAHLARVFTSRPLLCLGSISFSVYLIHEPLLVGISTVVPTDASWLVPLVGVPVSLFGGWIFYILVEKQSQP